jgi:hypothetical protein
VKRSIVVGAIALAAGFTLAGCGSSAHVRVVTVHVTQTVTAKLAPSKAIPAKPKPSVTAPASTQAAPLPTVSIDINGDPGQVEPSKIGLSEDGNGWLSGITWSSWTADSAEGSGSIDLNNGVPNMAQGTVANVTVSIALSAPASSSHPYFTAMTVTDSAGNKNTYADTTGPSGGMTLGSDGLSADIPVAASGYLNPVTLANAIGAGLFETNGNGVGKPTVQCAAAGTDRFTCTSNGGFEGTTEPFTTVVAVSANGATYTLGNDQPQAKS